MRKSPRVPFTGWRVATHCARVVVACVALAAGACGSGTERPALGSPAQPILIAHRGASGLAPEHTLAAYERAIEIGANYLEHDLQRTRDGALVVLHDETLDRTARGPAENCTGPVRSKTLAQLETCDFGLWFAEGRPDAVDAFAGERILTLDAVLKRFGRRAGTYIETKHPQHAPGLEEALLALLEAHDLLAPSVGAPSVVIQSFSAESLQKIHKLRPDLPLIQLLDEGETAAPFDEMLAAVAEYAAGIGPYHPEVDAPLLAAARRHGLVVHAWTVNSEADLVRLLEAGVDGVFTDYPDRYVEVRARRTR
jgi:glycerophosphoryl diester phosphodiesterase